MERRLSERKPIEHEVVLYYPGVGMLCCKTVDMSMDGAFIKISHVSVSAESEIELAFNSSCESQIRSVRLCGRVVRTRLGGIGVNFTRFHEGAYAYLKQLMAD